LNLDEIRACSSFDELYELVERLIRLLHMIGELTVRHKPPDRRTFRVLPERVYLHAGTRVGARRLGLDWRARAIECGSLPSTLQVLTAREAEDVLCMYDE
jgi:hypothetical protein